jgi:23S rRNA (cytidine2498-2'-O)-methyltransferase
MLSKRERIFWYIIFVLINMEKTEPTVNTNRKISFLENVGIEAEGKSSAYIVTYTPYFEKSVKKEVYDIDSNFNTEKEFSPSKALITSMKPGNIFIEELKESSPIFIKHIMPVMVAGKIEGDLERDKVKLLQSVDLILSMKKGSKFAVQCRLVKANLPYTAKDIEVYVGSYYEREGYVPSFSDREIINEDINIISIFIYNSEFYTGFSRSSDNLNFHSDEYRISSRAGGREISRAENKLIEALASFNVELEGNGTALDLGAAPGGWSKVLADYGYNVLAVDPAELHPKLDNNPNIEHIRKKAQDIKLEKPLDLIVNDMNMEPKETAKIMNKVAPLLRAGGLAIVTIKLPFNPERGITEAKEILSNKYNVLKIKSLFHNRQEVTALLKKKP